MFSICSVFLLIVHVTCVYSNSDVSNNKRSIATIFEGLGYSPLCVASALASCERFVNADYQFHIAELIPEMKTILRDTKCAQKTPQSDSLVENKIEIADLIVLLRELKLETRKGNDLALENKNLLIKLLTSQFTNLELKNSLHKENISVSTCINKKPKNCRELLLLNDTTSGVRVVYPYVYDPSHPVIVYCDQATDGGGWTYIQNRDPIYDHENFYRNWADYKNGFGTAYEEFWLGLDNIHAMTTSAEMELRVDLEDYEGATRFAQFKQFRVGDESSLYKLNVGEYFGTAGDSLARHNGKPFSTYDLDNDESKDVNCAIERHGAWWYTDCDDSNLNGYPYVRSESSNYHGIQWDTFHSGYYSLKRSNMKVRPVAV